MIFKRPLIVISLSIRAFCLIDLINNIISRITKNWKTNYKIILTGGYANLFKKIVKKRCIIDQNITIKGVSKVYREFL